VLCSNFFNTRWVDKTDIKSRTRNRTSCWYQPFKDTRTIAAVIE
jgi:hypothetical protein